MLPGHREPPVNPWDVLVRSDLDGASEGDSSQFYPNQFHVKISGGKTDGRPNGQMDGESWQGATLSGKCLDSGYIESVSFQPNGLFIEHYWILLLINRALLNTTVFKSQELASGTQVSSCAILSLPP